MYRYFILIFSFFFLSGAYAQDLSATMKMPESVEPGEDYITEVTINKGPINSYIKFSQKLPTNFKATIIDARGGNFTFDDSIIKIVWFFPPANGEFSFSYKVHVPDDASGNKKIGGKIYYFFNTDRQVFSFDKHFISIGKDKKDIVTTSATKVVDNETSGNPTVKEINTALTNAASVVKTDSVLLPLVKKDSISNSTAQLNQPKDTAKAISITSPVLTTIALKDTTAVIVPSPKPNLPNTNVSAKTLSDTVKYKDTTLITIAKPISKVVVNDTLPTSVAIHNKEKVIVKDSTPVIKNEIKTQEQVIVNVPKVNSTPENKINVDSAELIYSVQVGTYKEEVPLETANKFLQIAAKGYKNLKVDNGYTTFVVGNFKTKEEAIPLKNKMVEKGFTGAFVVGYPAKNVYSSIKNKQIKKVVSDVNKNKNVSSKVSKNSENKNSGNLTESDTKSEKKLVSTIGNSSVVDSLSSKRTYSIQIGAFKEEVPLEIANKFLTLASKGVKNIKNDLGLTVYTVGSFKSREEALIYKNQLIEKGFQDAFVVAFENGKIVK